VDYAGGKFYEGAGTIGSANTLSMLGQTMNPQQATGQAAPQAQTTMFDSKDYSFKLDPTVPKPAATTPAAPTTANTPNGTDTPCMSDSVKQTDGWFTVFATREGLIGQTTATGHVIGADDLFVALPSRTALNCWVEVSHNDITIPVQVLDVGPWNTKDPYWMTDDRPQAETGVDKFGRKTNGAGIDLSNGVFKGLGLTDNSIIRWRFLP
jgi:hypothetical protein